MEAVPETDIILYTSGSPNGQKISIILEELGLKYKVYEIQINKNEQKEDWYHRINPNGSIPAIIDKTPISRGKTQERRMFGGASIMLYLCQKYGVNSKLSYPFDHPLYWEVLSWLTWLESTIGPTQNQANHFLHHHDHQGPSHHPYALTRSQKELKRLYTILETRLQTQSSQNLTAAGTQASTAGCLQPSSSSSSEGQGPWIVGGKMTIADLACFAWVNWSEWAGVRLGGGDGDEVGVRDGVRNGDANGERDGKGKGEKEGETGFPTLKKWCEDIRRRDSVKKGLDVPGPFQMKEYDDEE